MKVRLKLTPMFNNTKFEKINERIDKLVQVVDDMAAVCAKESANHINDYFNLNQRLDLTSDVAKHADAETLKFRTSHGDTLASLGKRAMEAAEDVSLLTTDYLSLVEANRELSQKFDALVAHLKVEVVMDPLDLNSPIDTPTTFHVKKLKVARKKPVVAKKKPANLHKAAPLGKAKKAAPKKIK
jgi:hypothetical protein